MPVAPGQDLDQVLRVTGEVVAELNAEAAWHDLLIEPFMVHGYRARRRRGHVLRVVVRARPGGDAARLAREARLRLLQTLERRGHPYGGRSLATLRIPPRTCRRRHPRTSEPHFPRRAALPLRIYDTLTREKREFVAGDSRHASACTCAA